MTFKLRPWHEPTIFNHSNVEQVGDDCIGLFTFLQTDGKTFSAKIFEFVQEWLTKVQIVIHYEQTELVATSLLCKTTEPHQI